ncbi:hypothetical protein ACHAWF_013369 [Thalassiosira exigua]
MRKAYGSRRLLSLFSVALLFLAPALPSSAFASSAGTSSLRTPERSSPRLRSRRPPFVRVRGGGVSSSASGGGGGNMSGGEAMSRPVRKVVVVGGTHGNEYTGVWCIKAIERQREMHRDNNLGSGMNDRDNIVLNVFKRFPSLIIGTLLANPVAHMENKRFVDVDLNREFSSEKLMRVSFDEEVTEEMPHEVGRAREIQSLLGPKVAAPTPPRSSSPSTFEDVPHAESNTDVVIDLHTTTANMGISLIIAEGDPLMAAAAAYVLHKCREQYGGDGAQCILMDVPRRSDQIHLPSCGRHGFTIEVGPTPQGVLRHDVVEKTEAALHALLEFLHLRNGELEKDDGGDISGVLGQLEEIYPGGVPCYRSAPAVRPGELSGKIGWPSCPTNPNFPARMVHKSLQDRDFHLIRVGDPLFVELDGSIIPYDGSHGEEVHLIFVNEGGYYYASSGTGIGVALKSHFDWRTGEKVTSRLPYRNLLHPRREPRHNHRVVRVPFLQAHAAHEQDLRVGLQAVPEEVRERRVPVGHGSIELAPRVDHVVERVDGLVGELRVVLFPPRRVADGFRRAVADVPAARAGGGDVRSRHVDELELPLGAHARGHVHGGDVDGGDDVRPPLVLERIGALPPQALGAAGEGLPPDRHDVLERADGDRYQPLHHGVPVDIGADFELSLAPGFAAGAAALPVLVPSPVSGLAEDDLSVSLGRRRARHEIEQLLVVDFDHGHGEGVLVAIGSMAGDDEELLDGLQLHAVALQRGRLALDPRVAVDHVAQKRVRLAAAPLPEREHRHVEPVQRADERFLQLGEHLVLRRPRGEHPVELEARGLRLLVQHEYVVRGYLDRGPLARARPAVHPHRAPEVLELVEELEPHGALGGEALAEVVGLGRALGDGAGGAVRPVLGLAAERPDVLRGDAPDRLELAAQGGELASERGDAVVDPRVGRRAPLPQHGRGAGRVRRVLRARLRLGAPRPSEVRPHAGGSLGLLPAEDERASNDSSAGRNET